MMATGLKEMLLIRTFIEPFGENPTHNNHQYRSEARELFVRRLTSSTFISEIL